MNGKATVDQFSQKAYVNCEESAATTLTFTQLSNVAAALGSTTAMVINRIEYNFSDASYALLVGAGDSIIAGLSLSNNISGLSPEYVQNFDRCVLSYNAQAVGMGERGKPIVHDFSTMPGGGLIVPVKRLYGAIIGISVASAARCEINFYYTLKPMKDSEYYEMVQALDLLT